MSFHFNIFLILCSLFFTACPYSPKPQPPSHQDACADAQKTLDALDCPYAHTAKDASFEEVCTDAGKEGIDLKPECIADAKSCAQADSCH